LLVLTLNVLARRSPACAWRTYAANIADHLFLGGDFI